MNSRILATGAVLALVASGAATADPGRGDRGWDRDRDRDYARVVAVEPMVERVRYSVPVRDCWVEGRERRPVDRTGAAIVGGAVGAVIGNSIGHGDGRRAATIGGALVGAVLGNEAARGDARRGSRYQEVERCRTRYEDRFDERVSSYRVTYLYNGRRGVTHLPYEPGRFIRVAVDVHPLG